MVQDGMAAMRDSVGMLDSRGEEGEDEEDDWKRRKREHDGEWMMMRVTGRSKSFQTEKAKKKHASDQRRPRCSVRCAAPRGCPG